MLKIEFLYLQETVAGMLFDIFHFDLIFISCERNLVAFDDTKLSWRPPCFLLFAVNIHWTKKERPGNISKQKFQELAECGLLVAFYFVNIFPF